MSVLKDVKFLLTNRRDRLIICFGDDTWCCSEGESGCEDEDEDWLMVSDESGSESKIFVSFCLIFIVLSFVSFCHVQT